MTSPNSKRAHRDVLHWFLSAIIGSIFALILLQTPLELTWPVPLWMTFPFIALLIAIAVTPLVNPDWWHHNYPNVSMFLGGFVACFYGFGYDIGPSKLAHAGLEYLSFIALIGGLFFVASCIKLEISGKGRPLLNTFLLGTGAVLSNLLGTTGASMLLIRPFIKLNHGRIQPLHIVFFIILVSNCGGALTPIGDPPLYLGYLKGVPFTWTFYNLGYDWLFVVGALLCLFFLYDSFMVKQLKLKDLGSRWIKFRVQGKVGVLSLILMISAVFVDPLLAHHFGISGLPISALLQIFIATTCFVLTSPEIKKFNEFTIAPFKEVALLFAGIFATMVPALDYLASHGAALGLTNPMAFYFGTGLLSALLDNAPTYLNFLQIAIGPTEINLESVTHLISSVEGAALLSAISTGAVFFGALTYIGNGPNFMVRSISDNVGVKTPSFFGYFVYALCILGPILVLHALIFF